jgi:hypothetical protein
VLAIPEERRALWYTEELERCQRRLARLGRTLELNATGDVGNTFAAERGEPYYQLLRLRRAGEPVPQALLAAARRQLEDMGFLGPEPDATATAADYTDTDL